LHNQYLRSIANISARRDIKGFLYRVVSFDFVGFSLPDEAAIWHYSTIVQGKSRSSFLFNAHILFTLDHGVEHQHSHHDPFLGWHWRARIALPLQW
jgi:hypothetical protein